MTDARHVFVDCGDILLVNDPAVLPLLYSACETVLVGGTLLEPPSSASRPFVDSCESLASPAVAGCTVLVGSHGGAISAMAEDLNLAAVAASEEAAAAVRNTGEEKPRAGYLKRPAHLNLRMPALHSYLLVLYIIAMPDLTSTPPLSPLSPRLRHEHGGGPCSDPRCCYCPAALAVPPAPEPHPGVPGG